MALATFLNPEMLWALFAIPLIVALHFFLLRFAKRRSVLFANFEAMRRVTGEMVLSKNLTLLALRVLMIISLCLSAAGLTVWLTGTASEFNYVFAIDTSTSMLADDFAPSRFDVVKSNTGTFIDSLDGKINIGVVSFSGVPKTESVVSTKRSDVSYVIDSMKISPVGGTDINNAIFTSVNLLLSSKSQASSIILITDGQQTVGGSIDEGIKYAVDNAVAIYAIGMGTAGGGSFEMSDLLSTLDEESLDRIAGATGGKFYKVSSADDLDAAFTDIIKISEQKIPYQLRMPLLIAALIIFFVEWALANTKFKVLP